MIKSYWLVTVADSDSDSYSGKLTMDINQCWNLNRTRGSIILLV